jgi:hypothetical protein
MMKKNQLALWAGVSAFFATLLAVGAIDILNPSDQASLLSGVVVGLITAGAVYSKQRLVDAKDERIHGGVLQITEVGDKKVFTLELSEEPVIFEDKKEVVFQVNVDPGEK